MWKSIKWAYGGDTPYCYPLTKINGESLSLTHPPINLFIKVIVYAVDGS